MPHTPYTPHTPTPPTHPYTHPPHPLPHTHTHQGSMTVRLVTADRMYTFVVAKVYYV